MSNLLIDCKDFLRFNLFFVLIVFAGVTNAQELKKIKINSKNQGFT